jgi:hypothetical protein
MFFRIAYVLMFLISSADPQRLDERCDHHRGPLFYLPGDPRNPRARPGKGGFAGLGMISTPLLALCAAVAAAAILLPILLCPDAISVWAYRRHWSA